MEPFVTLYITESLINVCMTSGTVLKKVWQKYGKFLHLCRLCAHTFFEKNYNTMFTDTKSLQIPHMSTSWWFTAFLYCFLYAIKIRVSVTFVCRCPLTWTRTRKNGPGPEKILKRIRGPDPGPVSHCTRGLKNRI